MNFTERRKYLALMRRRYLEASRAERSGLLDEMEAVTRFHRKYLIRLMQDPVALQRKPRRRERGPVYGSNVRAAVSLIARALDYPAAERLQPVLRPMALLLAQQGLLQVDEDLLNQLEVISVATTRRILDQLPRDKPRPAASGPRPHPAPLLKIPAGRIPWNIGEPGHFEIDLVHHCGLSASGEYIYTLVMVDVDTGWTELRAFLDRSYRVVEDAFRQVFRRIPFSIRELHPDNGSEFFNAHLLRFWEQHLPEATISRSRPYHKNDNRFVEERNHTLVRSWIGDDRLDTVAQTLILNRVYDRLWVYANLFLPVMRMAEKVQIPVEGGKFRTRRIYDRARPPLERLEEKGVIPPHQLEALKQLRDQTNPLQLREEIYTLIEHLFSLPGATPGVTENVFETLNLPPILPEAVLAPVTLSFDG
ncbi:MAG: transposase family protein [Thermoflexales bacterium]|nr:transposase family protein [Thermoflexales bacterium]